MKRLIRQINAKDLNTSLLNINTKLAALNIEYNYANLIANIRQFEYYYNLLAEALGIDVKISVSVRLDHSNKIRIDLVKGGKELKLPDVNTVFHLATDMLINFDASIRGLYSSYNNEYIEHTAESSVETSYADDIIGELKAEEAELETQTAKDGATQQEIAEAIQQADTETQGRVDEAREEGSDVWDSTWETNKGSTTTSEEQERAMEAAREFAEDQARQNDLNNEAKAANEAANQANAAAQAANAAAQEAQEAANNAQNAANSAYNETQTAQGAVDATMGLTTGGGYDYNTESFVPGSYTENNTTYTVTDNGNGTVTITSTLVDADGNEHTTAQTVTNDHAGLEAASNHATDNLAAADQAFNEAVAEAQAAQAAAQEANAAAAAANAEAKATQEAADEANQAAADASIPTASDDDLDNGWYNDSGSEGVNETSQDVIDDFNFD